MRKNLGFFIVILVLLILPGSALPEQKSMPQSLETQIKELEQRIIYLEERQKAAQEFFNAYNAYQKQKPKQMSGT